MKDFYGRKLMIAVPVSILSVEPSLEMKTVKIGSIARAAAIYRASSILLYPGERIDWRDIDLFKTVLDYMVTAPYLRKKLYGLDSRLRYAGLLPPLQLPTHGVGGPRRGEVRQALVVKQRGPSRLLVDAGLGSIVEARTTTTRSYGRNSLVHVRLEEVDPPKLVVVDDPPVYTGYRVEPHDSLSSIVRKYASCARIATSRKGSSIDRVEADVAKLLEERQCVVVLFGSHTLGLYELAEQEGYSLEDVADIVVNTIPYQGTATVRTEEAVHASLAVLNMLAKKMLDQPES